MATTTTDVELVPGGAWLVYGRGRPDPWGWVVPGVRGAWRVEALGTGEVYGPFATRAAAEAWIHLQAEQEG